MTSFEKMSWFEYWKHAFLEVIRMSSKVLYQHCMLVRYVGIVFWMQKIQRNSSNSQFHCFRYVRKRAHFEAYVSNFSKHLWKLAISQKLWVPAHSEVSLSGTMTAKMNVFRPLIGRKWFFEAFWPKEHPQVLYMVGKLRISSFRW